MSFIFVIKCFPVKFATITTCSAYHYAYLGDGFHYCSNAFSRINKRIDATLSPRTCRLPSWHVCDGVGHCENRTDECVKGCDRSFSCDGGENCVAKSGLCDGHASCRYQNFVFV